MAKELIDHDKYFLPKELDLQPIAEVVKAIPINPILSALASTEAGRILQNTPRWQERYFFPQHRDNSKVWELWFGQAGNTFDHLVLETGRGIKLLWYEGDNFTPEQQTLFILANLSHDFGEAIRGDKAAGTKTNEEESLEAIAAHQVVDSLPLKKYQVPEIWRERLHQVLDEIVFHPDPASSPLAYLHKAQEKFSYLHDAISLHATEKVDHGLANTDVWYIWPYAMDWLIARVLAYDIPKLANVYAPAFPQSIGRKLDWAGYWLGSMFPQAWSDTSDWIEKPPASIQDNFVELNAKVETAFNAWQQWMASVGINQYAKAWYREQEIMEQLAAEWRANLL